MDTKKEGTPPMWPDGKKIRTMSPHEFLKLGILQEVNRRILNRMGLSLVLTEKDGLLAFGPVLDIREDPEGFILDKPDLAAAQYVDSEIRARQCFRSILFGGDGTQPVGPIPIGIMNSNNVKESNEQ